MSNPPDEAPLTFEEARARAEKALKGEASGDKLLQAVYDVFAFAANEGRHDYLQGKRADLLREQRKHEEFRPVGEFELGGFEAVYNVLSRYADEYGEDLRVMDLPDASAGQFIAEWAESEPSVPNLVGASSLADVRGFADERLGKHLAKLAVARDKAWLAAMQGAMLAAAVVHERDAMRAPLWNELEEKSEFSCREPVPFTGDQVTFRKKGAFHIPFKKRILDYVIFCVCESERKRNRIVLGRIYDAAAEWHVEMHGYLIRRYARGLGLDPWNGSISTKTIRTWRTKAVL